MGLKSINVIPVCKKHGDCSETVSIAGGTYCPKCMKSFLDSFVGEVIMTTFENDDDSNTIKCHNCGNDRMDDERPCAWCGAER